MPRGAGFRRLTGRQRIQRNFYRPDWRWKWFSGSRSFAAVVAPYLLPSLNLRQHFIRKCHLVHDYPLSVNAGCRLGLYLLLRNAQRTRVARNRKEVFCCLKSWLTAQCNNIFLFSSMRFLGRSGHLTSFSMDLAQPMGASLAMSGRVRR